VPGEGGGGSEKHGCGPSRAAASRITDVLMHLSVDGWRCSPAYCRVNGPRSFNFSPRSPRT